jgi:hypothetical protein
MVAFNPRSNVAIGTTVGLCGLWLASVPRLVSNSTFALFAVLLIGGVSVAFITWRNAQAPGSVGQLLHETEIAGSSARAVSDGTRK